MNFETIQQTVDFIKSKTGFDPEIGIILGTGLGGLVDKIEVLHELDYASIPNFPVSTVKGHAGKLILGNLAGKRVAAMMGRFHFYEGYTMQELGFPVRVLKFLGIKTLLLSNASGGVNPDFHIGDLMVINDHINLIGLNPLIGPNDERLGPRFPDFSEPYSKALVERGLAIAADKGYHCHKGIYAALSGPCFETRAEYGFIRAIGADCVGMSTVPEVIVARHMGLPCFAMSIITDLGGPDHLDAITLEEVLRVAAEGEQKLTTIFTELIRSAL